MKYRDFGKTGLCVSEIGMGCGWVRWIQDDESTRLLERAFELGINFYDSADFYFNFESEARLTKAFANKRDQVILATKFGTIPDPNGWYQDFSVANMQKSLEGSLKRLQSDYIDIYQLHSPPLSILEQDDLLAALQQAKQEGKIRFYGISIDGAQFMRDAIDKWQVDSIQTGFNMFDMRAVEAFPYVKEKGVGLIARSPLDSGMLGGVMQTGSELRPGDPRPRWGEEKTQRRQQALAEVKFLLENKNRSYAQAALQFILAHDAIHSAIVGTTNLDHLAENAAASGTRLTDEEMCQLQTLMGGEFKKLQVGW